MEETSGMIIGLIYKVPWTTDAQKKNIPRQPISKRYQASVSVPPDPGAKHSNIVTNSRVKALHAPPPRPPPPPRQRFAIVMPESLPQLWAVRAVKLHFTIQHNADKFVMISCGRLHLWWINVRQVFCLIQLISKIWFIICRQQIKTTLIEAFIGLSIIGSSAWGVPTHV